MDMVLDECVGQVFMSPFQGSHSIPHPPTSYEVGSIISPFGLEMEDEQAVMVNLHRVTKSLLSGRITEKLAGLMLWSVAIGAPGATRITHRNSGGAEPRRKKRKHSPQMNADGRRSRHLGIGRSGDLVIGSPKSEKEKATIAEDPSLRSAEKTVCSEQETSANLREEHERRVHPGVKDGKSFRSGVDGAVGGKIAKIAENTKTAKIEKLSTESKAAKRMSQKTR
jgi:hypothetical protein